VAVLGAGERGWGCAEQHVSLGLRAAGLGAGTLGEPLLRSSGWDKPLSAADLSQCPSDHPPASRRCCVAPHSHLLSAKHPHRSIVTIPEGDLGQLREGLRAVTLQRGSTKHPWEPWGRGRGHPGPRRWPRRLWPSIGGELADPIVRR